jgi:hypothetical protein
MFGKTTKRRYAVRDRFIMTAIDSFGGSSKRESILPAKQSLHHISDDEIEAKIHSFVIKIWLDNQDMLRGTLSWRGHITHVTTSKRHYVQSLIDIIAFILPYLQEMGTKVSLYWRFIQWLSQKKRRSIAKGRSDDEHCN